MRVDLNGEETVALDIKPLGFGETGFLVYGDPVVLNRVRVEPGTAQIVRHNLRPWIGILLPILPALLLWLAVRRSGVPLKSAAPVAWAAWYPLAVYGITASAGRPVRCRSQSARSASLSAAEARPGAPAPPAPTRHFPNCSRRTSAPGGCRSRFSMPGSMAPA